MQFTEEGLFATIGRQALVIEHLNRQVAELRAQVVEFMRTRTAACNDNHRDAEPAPANGEGINHG